MHDYEMTQPERITRLEVIVQNLAEEVQGSNKKLDELLELKSKGMGAFWLASIVVGAVISFAGTSIVEWFRGY